MSENGIVEEKTLKTERIYEGSILNLRRDQVTVKDGRTSWREIVEHNGGVALAALTEEGKMIMVRQFRKAPDKIVLEVPAGKVEPGEAPELTARRELQEETGYTARSLRHLTSFYSSIGYSTEKIHLYLATGLTAGKTQFDENESIEVEAYTPDELARMIGAGKVEDAKTIIAILMVQKQLTAEATEPAV